MFPAHRKPLFFKKSNENLIIYYALEPSDKPVLAREREARWKEESFPNTILLCSTHVQNNVQIPWKNLHILHKSDIHEASDPEISSQRPQSGPRVPWKWLQCSQSEPKWIQSPLKVTPGAPKTNPSALKWSPKASPDPQNRSKKESKTIPGHL